MKINNHPGFDHMKTIMYPNNEHTIDTLRDKILELTLQNLKSQSVINNMHTEQTAVRLQAQKQITSLMRTNAGLLTHTGNQYIEIEEMRLLARTLEDEILQHRVVFSSAVTCSAAHDSEIASKNNTIANLRHEHKKCVLLGMRKIHKLETENARSKTTIERLNTQRNRYLSGHQ